MVHRPGTTTTTHTHRWRIEEPKGTVSQAVCSICDETRQFSNWVPQLDYLTASERSEK